MMVVRKRPHVYSTGNAEEGVNPIAMIEIIGTIYRIAMIRFRNRQHNCFNRTCMRWKIVSISDQIIYMA